MEGETLINANKIECRSKMDVEKQGTRNTPHKKQREFLVQVLFGFIANLVSIAPGMNLGFSAVALPVLQNPNSTFTVQSHEASWIASIASISTPLGCILTGSLLEGFGRKSTLVVVNIPSLIGWILIAFANGNSTLMMIYFGRFLTGLATGMAAVPATVYSAEMATDKLRGMFITWTSIFMSFGIMFVYVLGYFLKDNWRLVAGLSALFPATASILIYFCLPESPSWLLSKGKTVMAKDNFRKTRGIEKHNDWVLTLSQEFDLLVQKYESRTNLGSSQVKLMLQKFIKMSTIKPLIIMNLFFFFQQFSGIFVIIFYAVNVVKDSGVSLDPYMVAILIGACRVLVSILMSYLNKKYGRRPPSILSGAGMTLCMGCLATYLYLKSTKKMSQDLIDSFSWVPVASLLVYIITSTIGFLTLPWAMIGEVFPAEVRGLAAGFTTCFAYIFNFVIIKVYPSMVEAMTEYGVFFFYGAFAMLGTIFVILFLPETQGKTLLQIEEYFTSKKKKKTKNVIPNGIEMIEK